MGAELVGERIFGHYTSVEGVMGMVRDEKLWATNIKFLNDQQEFQHAFDMLRTILAQPQIAPKSHTELFTQFQDFVTRRLRGEEKYNSGSVFTLSFSARPDLLSQWRGYCPENNGYCVMYDAEDVLAAVRAEFENAHLVECVYDKEAKEKPFREILNRHWQSYVLAADDTKAREAIVYQLSKEIRLLAAYFKDASFSEEQEHRIVVLYEYVGASNVKFRSGRSSIVPYLELPAPRTAIKKVIIGPNRNQLLAERALEVFLENYFEMPMFIDGPGIERSEIPYRSL